jgi:hypothetical protein
MLLPIPLQYDGEDPAFMASPRFVARPITIVEFETADTDVTVDHDLTRVPMGYFVVGLSGNMTVYNGSVGWTAEQLSLRASAAGTASLLIF